MTRTQAIIMVASSVIAFGAGVAVGLYLAIVVL